MKILEKIFDAATGEETIIEREMTSEELVAHQAEIKRIEAEAIARAEAKAKREAAFSKLAALGLTSDDLKALGL